ncbi:MAG: lamin tail domain-containing protein, partial [Cyclobacteriaceae bacterium]|nr:lamin tail domain-containing protein [Cyclobacteriaceae bacterium]
MWAIAPVAMLLLLFKVNEARAQFADDFSDGDFTNNPTWTTNTPEHWAIDNFRLRSNSPVANSSFYLSTPSARATDAQWEFWVNLQFNTSGVNLVEVYLVSQNENLLAPGNNGYFVRIGGTPDEVSLFRMVNGVATIMIDGTNGVTNLSNNVLRIRVIRDEQHTWTLSYDVTGTGNNYFTEPPATDATILTSNFFGIRIAQSTATFFNRHFFDDIYAGDIIRDTDPPQLISVTPISPTVVEARFNEDLDESTAQQSSFYTINNGVGIPVSAALLPDNRTVRLTFINNFANGQTHVLSVQGVKDRAGNTVEQATASFFFFEPQPVAYKDIIFTELFPDPDPVIGLPQAEFVELYNRSANPVDLAGWRFSDPSSAATLPSHILLPGTYVIIAPNSAAPQFTSNGPVIGVTNFPTLNNSGDNLTLRDPQNNLIDFVNYTDRWYQDDDKRQGGWTLELIDINNICAESTNWVASEDQSGGTPGR